MERWMTSWVTQNSNTLKQIVKATLNVNDYKNFVFAVFTIVYLHVGVGYCFYFCTLKKSTQQKQYHHTSTAFIKTWRMYSTSFTLRTNHMNQSWSEMQQTWGCLLKSNVSPYLHNDITWSTQQCDKSIHHKTERQEAQLYSENVEYSVLLTTWNSKGFRQRLCLCLPWPWPLTLSVCLRHMMGHCLRWSWPLTSDPKC